MQHCGTVQCEEVYQCSAFQFWHRAIQALLALVSVGPLLCYEPVSFVKVFWSKAIAYEVDVSSQVAFSPDGLGQISAIHVFGAVTPAHGWCFTNEMLAKNIWVGR